MVYIYCRCSTQHQNIQRQIRNCKEVYPDGMVIEESYTGTSMNRPQWNKLMKLTRQGDIICFDSVSRMSRTSEEGFKVYKELYDRGIELIFLKEPQISTVTYKKALETALPMTNTSVDYILEGINKYLMVLAEEQIKLAFEVSELEVNQLHQRVKEGLVTARLNGKTLGRHVGMKVTTEKSIRDKNIILKYSKYFNGTLPDKEVLKLVECSRNTFYKYKKELIIDNG